MFAAGDDHVDEGMRCFGMQEPRESGQASQESRTRLLVPAAGDDGVGEGEEGLVPGGLEGGGDGVEALQLRGTENAWRFCKNIYACVEMGVITSGAGVALRRCSCGARGDSCRLYVRIVRMGEKGG